MDVFQFSFTFLFTDLLVIQINHNY